MGVEEEDGFILFGVFGAAKSSGRLIGGWIWVRLFLAVTRSQFPRIRRDFCVSVVTACMEQRRSHSQ